MKDALKRICGWFTGNTILLLTGFFLATALLAQDDALTAKINTTRALIIKERAASDYRGSIRKSVLDYENSLSTRCKTVDLEFDSASDRILIPIEMNDKGVPVSGSWRETVPGTACNEQRMYNVQVDATKKGLHFTPTYPGTAQGNPELQRDTLRNIELDLIVMSFVKKSCRAEVLDTKLVGPAARFSDNGLLSPWNEAWEVRACGKLFTVPVKFVPDATGTSISVGASDIQAH